MQSNRIYREHETSFACEIAGQERSFCVRKIRRTYNKLNSMAFVAHARPEAPKRLRQGESFDPAPRGKSDTHACSLNKGIGCKSRTRKESVAGLQSVHLRLQARGRIPKVAVFLKYCFPCREICARWKPVIGRAVMAPREGWSNAFVRGKILRTWIDQSEDLQTPKRWIGSMAIASYPHTFWFRFGVKRYKTQRRWL